MKLNKIAVAILLFIFSKDSFGIVFPSAEEVLIANRIQYLNNMRKFAGDLFWPDFANDSSVGAVVYFTHKSSYLFNADQASIDKIEGKYDVIVNPNNTKMLRLENPFDSAVYVMETQFDYDDSRKNRIDYKKPTLFCTSTEAIAGYSQNVKTTEDWTVSVLHEYYHQYQLRHDAVFNYVLSLLKQKTILTRDTLQGIFRTNQSYHDTLMRENDNLLKAIAATSLEEEKGYFKEFLRLRNKRYQEYNKKYKTQINIPEDFWEKMEGTAQFMEATTRLNFSKFPVDSTLLETDPMYHGNAAFEGFSFDTAPEFYNPPDAVYYLEATGFNLVRLLEKNKVEYKGNFFNYASLPLHMQLKYFYKL